MYICMVFTAAHTCIYLLISMYCMVDNIVHPVLCMYVYVYTYLRTYVCTYVYVHMVFIIAHFIDTESVT